MQIPEKSKYCEGRNITDMQCEHLRMLSLHYIINDYSPTSGLVIPDCSFLCYWYDIFGRPPLITFQYLLEGKYNAEIIREMEIIINVIPLNNLINIEKLDIAVGPHLDLTAAQ